MEGDLDEAQKVKLLRRLAADRADPAASLLWETGQ
jgi:hypothetical protein